MPVFASIFERHGRAQEAKACRKFAASPEMLAEDPFRLDLVGGIARLGDAWYLHDRSDPGMLDAAGLQSPDPEADCDAARLLRADPLSRQDLRPLLAGLAVSALLIVGEADLVTSPDQIDSFASAFGSGSVRRVGEAGHYVQGNSRRSTRDSCSTSSMRHSVAMLPVVPRRGYTLRGPPAAGSSRQLNRGS
jgi:pimeloyl-ACP methyl ester carboxylesterase